MRYTTGAKVHLLKHQPIAKKTYLTHGLSGINAKDYGKLEVIDFEVIEKPFESINMTLTTKGLVGKGKTKYKGYVYALLDKESIKQEGQNMRVDLKVPKKYQECFDYLETDFDLIDDCKYMLWLKEGWPCDGEGRNFPVRSKAEALRFIKDAWKM